MNTCNPRARKVLTEDPWGLVVSQFRQIQAFRVSERYHGQHLRKYSQDWPLAPTHLHRNKQREREGWEWGEGIFWKKANGIRAKLSLCKYYQFKIFHYMLWKVCKYVTLLIIENKKRNKNNSKSPAIKSEVHKLENIQNKEGGTALRWLSR